MIKINRTDDAKAAYKKRQNSIAENISQIQRKLEKHTQGKEPHWAHVGDLGHVEELLEEINEFLGA